MAQSQKHRTQAWIERLEEKAQLLLDVMEDKEALDQLTTKERIDLAVKMLTQIQRFTMLQMQAEAGTPSGGADLLLSALMRQMRGELLPPMPIITEEGGGEP